MPSRDRPSGPASLAFERLLPRSRRQEWARDLVWFQIDDLNGLFDGLQGKDVPAARVEGARERVERVLLAASWDEETYREHAWAFVEEGLERPEDGFGPALILGEAPALPGGAKRWLSDLPDGVARTIAKVRPDQARRRIGLPK
jgi:hypothetical protein